MPTDPLHLAVALDAAGWHPSAWREPDAQPERLFDARYWVDLVREAEAGKLDLVTLEDSLGLQSGHWSGPEPRGDRVRGRLDAVLVAARVAPLTRGIGLVPTAVVTHTEPFHLSKAIATLDYVSNGRAGVRVQVSARAHEAAHFGRREVPRFGYAQRDEPEVRAVVADLFGEAADWVEVVRRLWDSWEDDAEIRDVATGRFVDIDKLHYIDFEGSQFSVRGPSITPRPPQGQPLVSLLAHQTLPYQLAATSADLVHVTPRSNDEASTIVDEVRRLQDEAGRADDTLHVWGDLVVALDDTGESGASRLARLDEVAGEPLVSDAEVLTGTAAEVADVLLERQGAGLTGFRLRPLTIPGDLVRITRDLVPELQRRGAFRTDYDADTLRGLLGLPRPASRYAA
jgi:alkanesulfonate monooxygenase SsuD/methylene tetrahydromethanopterin reductase-like flavin-dependent oxidoreductase (luciferase family)